MKLLDLAKLKNKLDFETHQTLKSENLVWLASWATIEDIKTYFVSNVPMVVDNNKPLESSILGIKLLECNELPYGEIRIATFMSARIISSEPSDSSQS